MEKDDPDPATSQVSENSLVHEVHMMKVCVAVACCAIKPKDTPIRTFTEGLCAAFHNETRQLRNRQTSLEAELLHLRQQMAMDSGPQSSHEKGNVQQDVSQGDVEVLFPTPPSSGTDINNAALVERRDFDSLHRNTEFLQSVINLQQVTRQASERLSVGDKTALTSEKDYLSLEVKLKSITSLNHSTVVQSLQTINRCIQDKTFMVSVKSLQRCIQCIVQLMEQLPDLASNIPIVSLIKDIVKSLVDDILNIQEDSTQQNSRQQSINLVLEFSKPSVTIISQEVLVEEIQRFSRHLQDVCVNGKSLQVSWFENIIFVIQLLQTVLDKYYSSPVTKDPALLQGLKDKLDDSLLHVTHRYPLFAHSIWNICGQLELQLWKITSI